MDRRRFLGLAAGAPLLAAPFDAYAWMFCGPFTINGAHYCYASLRTALAHVPAAAVDGRHHVRWCWAACAEMLLAYHGHPVGQRRIVTEAWGSIAAVPERAEAVITGLTGDWIDDAGGAFQLRAERHAPTPLAAARVLEREVPLVLATATHPVILTMLRYVAMRGDDGRIQAADVHDPWPGRRKRLLSQAEWREATALYELGPA